MASLAQLASQRHPIEFLDSLPHLEESVIQSVDVGLYDLQERRLISLRDGKPVDPADWSASVRLQHHGNHLGRLMVNTTADVDPLADLLEAVAAVVALTITSAYDFDDQPWTTVRTKEMSLAAEIQATVIPPSSCLGKGFAVSAAVEPAYDTGGDIFEYAFDGNRLFLAVLDAVGHGLAASHLASLATAALRRARREGAALLELLGQVDDSIRSQYDGTAYVSALVAEIDTATGHGRWVSAGHLPPLIVGDNGVRELAIDPALPLGMWISGDESFEDLPVGTLALEPGESIVLYSDGIIENLLESSEDSVGDERFRSAVQSHARPHTHRCARERRGRVAAGDGSGVARRRNPDDRPPALINRFRFPCSRPGRLRPTARAPSRGSRQP